MPHLTGRLDDTWGAWRSVRDEPSTLARRRALAALFAQGHRDLFGLLRLGLDPYSRPLAERAPRVEGGGDDGDLTAPDAMRLFLNLSTEPSFADDGLRLAASHAHPGAWNDLLRPLILGSPPGGIDAALVNAALRGAGVEANDFRIPEIASPRPFRARSPTELPRGEWMVEFPPQGRAGVVLLDGRSPRPRSTLDLPGPATEALGALSTRMFQTPCAVEGVLETRSGVFHASDIVPLADHRSGRCSRSTRARHDVLAAVFGSLPARSPARVLPKRLAEVGIDGEALAELAAEATAEGAVEAVFKRPNAGWRSGPTRDWRVVPIGSLASRACAA